MKKYLLFGFGFLFFGCGQPQLHQINGFAQGSTYQISYIHPNELKLKQQIDSIVEVIDQSMSNYKDGSLINQINNNENHLLDAHFLKVFRASKEIWQETDGLFDPSVGELFNLWGFGEAKRKQIPTQTQIDSVLAFSGMDKFQLTPKNELLKLNNKVKLNFNAIAQGYTCDVIADFLKQQGVENFIVELGGEIVTAGKNVIKGKKWRIGIDNPLQNPDEPREIIDAIDMEQNGLATSGNYRKVWVDSLTGRKFVHTINPKTGYPQVNNLLSATVIAPNAMFADAYATSLMVMGFEKAVEFAKTHPQLKVLLLYSDEDDPQQVKKYTNF